ncbi:hypothetical protein D3C80_1941570 [compost metagenome]
MIACRNLQTVTPVTPGMQQGNVLGLRESGEQGIQLLRRFRHVQQTEQRHFPVRLSLSMMKRVNPACFIINP